MKYGKYVYLATPGYSEEEKITYHRYEEAIESVGYTLYSPFRDAPKVDFSTDSGRHTIYNSNATAMMYANYAVINLDWTTSGGKWPNPAPDTGVNFEVGFCAGIKAIRAKYLEENVGPRTIAVTSDPKNGINIMLRYGVDGLVCGIDRFLDALKSHRTLDVFLNNYDNPVAKKWIFY